MKGDRLGSTNREIADTWDITERQVINLRKNGVPLESLSAMLNFVASNPDGISSTLKAKLADLGAEAQAAGASAAPGVDPDWEEFQSLTQGKVDDDPKAAMAAIAKARAFASFKFEKASAANRRADMKFYADLLTKLEGTLHDAQLRAKKLGIDQGELVPRSEVERILRAWAFWSMRSVDADLADLCPKLTGLAQVNDARAVLEPALLSARFLKPFVRASRISSPAAVPTWMVAIVQDAVDDYIENGAGEFLKAS